MGHLAHALHHLLLEGLHEVLLLLADSFCSRCLGRHLGCLGLVPASASTLSLLIRGALGC